MKRIATLLMAALLMLSSPVAAGDRVKVTVNGEELAMTTAPIIVEQRTLVPLRIIAEVFGGVVSWVPEGQYIVIVFGEDRLEMMIGAAGYAFNSFPYLMDAAPILHEDRTMVPLRAIAEILGCQVSWDGTTRTVDLIKEGINVPENHRAPEKIYTDEDVLWLARIVNVEGLDIGYEAKLAIANVVLNRVKGDEYPDTVYDVIKDTDYAVQFPPAHRSSFDTLTPDVQSYQAARDALDGINNAGDCLYFNNAPFKWKASDLYMIIEGEYFYR